MVSCHDLGTSEHFLNQRCPLFIISKKIRKSGGVVAEQYSVGDIYFGGGGGGGGERVGNGYFGLAKRGVYFFQCQFTFSHAFLLFQHHFIAC